MGSSINDPKNISKEFAFKSLFIDKHLTINFAEYIGKDPKKIFFGFDFEIMDRALYVSYVENDNDDSEKFYEIDLSIYNDKSTSAILKELEDSVFSICKDINTDIDDFMINVGKLILSSDLMDVYRYYCDIGKTTKVYKCSDDNVLIAIDGNYVKVIHAKDNTIDYLYDLFMACMDKHPSFALKCFFEKNTN